MLLDLKGHFEAEKRAEKGSKGSKGKRMGENTPLVTVLGVITRCADLVVLHVSRVQCRQHVAREHCVRCHRSLADHTVCGPVFWSSSFLRRRQVTEMASAAISGAN